MTVSISALLYIFTVLTQKESFGFSDGSLLGKACPTSLEWDLRSKIYGSTILLNQRLLLEKLNVTRIFYNYSNCNNQVQRKFKTVISQRNDEERLASCK